MSLSSERSTAASSSAPRETVLASWLHVSDLHFGHGDAGHQWNQRLVLEELRIDAQALVRDGVVPKPDFIFVTGDIAFSGGARTPATGEAEYALASQWFRQLQEVLETPNERVLMVPGNHDVDRRVDADVRRLLRLARSGEETIDELLGSPRDLVRLRERMAGYIAFAANFGSPGSHRFHDGLWWRHRVELAEGVSLRVCGLNTALFSVDDQDQGKLRVGQRQLAELLVPAPDELEIAVVLSHHPPVGRWLADEREVRGQLERVTAIHLFGHLHEADSEQARHGWGIGGLRIAAGAAHAEASTPGSPPVGHGYGFGALVVLESGDLAVRIWPRRWSTRAPRFVADVDITLAHREHAEHRLPEKYRLRRPPPKSGLHPGDVLGDRYRLVAEIGQGGVGQVWRASDLDIGELVAVKVLNPDRSEPDPGRLAGFFRGAKAITGLKHPAIVCVRDPQPASGKRPGPYFYVMDLVDAPNLKEAYMGAPRSDAETIEILLAIGEGIAAAHRQRVIHRDLKPSNILRDPTSGQVFIIDFDTAKDLGSLTMTRSGEGLASTYYASPEVLMSLNPPPGHVSRPDERADIFSLAVIGVFLRTGRNPPHFHMPDVIAGIDCVEGLRQVLAKGCAHSVAERYASVNEFLAALRKLQVSVEEPLRELATHRLPLPEVDAQRTLASSEHPRQPLQVQGGEVAPPMFAAVPESISKIPPPGGAPFPSPPRQDDAGEGSRGAPGTDAREASTTAPLNLRPRPPLKVVEMMPRQQGSSDDIHFGRGDETVVFDTGEPPPLRTLSGDAPQSTVPPSRSPQPSQMPRLQQGPREIGDGASGAGASGERGFGNGIYGVGSAGLLRAGSAPMLDVADGEVERPSTTMLGDDAPATPIARSRPLRRQMLQIGSALLAGFVALSLYGAFGGNPGDGDDGLVGVGQVSMNPGKNDERGTEPEYPRSLTKMARCPGGMVLIKGTDGHAFIREGETRNIDDFCLDLTEVTVEAFRLQSGKESYLKSKTLLEERRQGSEQWNKYCNARYEDRGDHPINCVDWDQARGYCESIGKRLPTEWEWEWAARGRDEGRAYPWGGEVPDCQRAIFGRGSLDGCGKDRTWAVGSLKGSLADSRDGLSDMSGNVWEWTSSVYGKENGNTSLRALRGGGFRDANGDFLRVSYRSASPPATRAYGTGFRCAKLVP